METIVASDEDVKDEAVGDLLRVVEQCAVVVNNNLSRPTKGAVAWRGAHAGVQNGKCIPIDNRESLHFELGPG